MSRWVAQQPQKTGEVVEAIEAVEAVEADPTNWQAIGVLSCSGTEEKRRERGVCE